MKRIATLAIAAAAVVALTVPATAAAVWQDNNQTLASHAQIELTGQFKYEAAFGWAECQVKMGLLLTAGTTTGDVQSFVLDPTKSETPTDDCSVGGGTQVLGCTDVEKVTTSDYPWVVHAVTKKTLAITTGTIQFHLHGSGFCQKTLQLTPGTMHFTTTTESGWAGGTISGLLQYHLSGPPQFANLQGTMLLLPGGTYGVN